MAAEAIPFAFLETAQLTVRDDDTGDLLIADVDFALEGQAIRPLRAFAGTISVTRATDIVQPSAFPPAQPIGGHRIEAALDRLAMIIQEQRAALATVGSPGNVLLNHGLFSVMDYGAVGDGLTDDRDAIQQAIDAVMARGGGVVICPCATYALAAPIDIKAGVILDLSGSTLKASPGAALTHLANIKGSRAQLTNGVLDGSGMAGPSIVPPEPYTHGPYKGFGVYISKANSPLETVLISQMRFANFPSSAVIVGGDAGINAIAFGLMISGCLAENMQTYTAAEGAAVFHLHGADASRISDCAIIGYNRKGFYIANASASQITRCHSFGGDPGHASHYMSGCTDCSINDCTHDGGNNAGFGFKCFNSRWATVRNFKAIRSRAAGMFQGCAGFLGDGISSDGAQASVLYIDGHAGSPTSGRLKNLFARRSAVGATDDHCGVKITNYAGATIDGIDIDGFDFDGMLFGFHLNHAGFAIDNVTITGGRLRNNQQYAVVGAATTLSVRGNRFDFANTAPAAVNLKYDGGAGTGTLTISENRISGLASVDIIQIGEGQRVMWGAVNIDRNMTVGGARLIDFNANANAADVVRSLSITGNHCLALTSEAYALTFNTTNATALTIDSNIFLSAANAPLDGSFANLATGLFEVIGSVGHVGTPEGNFAGRIGAQYRRTDGGAGTSFYVKESGTGKTGWVAK